MFNKDHILLVRRVIFMYKFYELYHGMCRVLQHEHLVHVPCILIIDSAQEPDWSLAGWILTHIFCALVIQLRNNQQWWFMGEIQETMAAPPTYLAQIRAGVVNIKMLLP